MDITNSLTQKTEKNDTKIQQSFYTYSHTISLMLLSIYSLYTGTRLHLIQCLVMLCRIMQYHAAFSANTTLFFGFFYDSFQSLGIFCSIPVGLLIISLFGLLLYLMTRCCDRKPRPQNSITSLKVVLSVVTVLCCAAIGLGELQVPLVHLIFEFFFLSTFYFTLPFALHFYYSFNHSFHNIFHFSVTNSVHLPPTAASVDFLTGMKRSFPDFLDSLSSPHFDFFRLSPFCGLVQLVDEAKQTIMSFEPMKVRLFCELSKPTSLFIQSNRAFICMVSQ